jgi:hypothetical protein
MGRNRRHDCAGTAALRSTGAQRNTLRMKSTSRIELRTMIPASARGSEAYAPFRDLVQIQVAIKTS